MSGSQDHTLRLWNLASGESRVLTGHTDRITALAILPDGLRALSGSEDSTLALWDLENGRKLRTLRTHTESVTALALLPNGLHALSASMSTYYSRPLLWNLETGESAEATFSAYSYVRALTVLSDGRRALMSGVDYNPDSSWAFESYLQLWDVATKDLLHTLEEARSTKTCASVVAVLPDGCRVLSGSWDGKLRLWDLKTGAFLAGFAGEASITCVAVARDDLFVASSENGAVHILKLVE